MKNTFLHKETEKFYCMFCQFEANSMDTLVMLFVSDTYYLHDLCQKKSDMVA